MCYKRKGKKWEQIPALSHHIRPRRPVKALAPSRFEDFRHYRETALDPFGLLSTGLVSGAKKLSMNSRNTFFKASVLAPILLFTTLSSRPASVSSCRMASATGVCFKSTLVVILLQHDLEATGNKCRLARKSIILRRGRLVSRLTKPLTLPAARIQATFSFVPECQRAAAAGKKKKHR